MIAIVFALIMAVGIVILFRGLETRRSSMAEIMQTRLDAYRNVEVMAADDEDLRASFTERILVPVSERLTKFLEGRTPESKRQALQIKLDLAGRPGNLSPAGFQALQYMGLAGGAALCGLVGLMLGPTWAILLLVAGALLGFFFPVQWLRQKVGQRTKEISKTLPDAMDLLTTSVEAGLSFDQALGEVTNRFKNALGAEFRTVLSEIKFGKPRAMALDDMGKRTNLEDVHNFVQAVIQSEQMGTSVAKVLRIQSSELRRVRRQRAQQKAGAAPVKMLLPMVGCIFPTLWIVLLGPAALLLMKSFSH